jgi:branched-chain amino acid transport system permease protein
MIGAVILVAIPDLAGAVASRFVSSEAVTNNLPGLLVSALLILAVLFVPNGPVEQLRAYREHWVKK